MHCITFLCTFNTLHCTEIYCTALHCNKLYSTAIHCTILHCITKHWTALHCIVHILVQCTTPYTNSEQWAEVQIQNFYRLKSYFHSLIPLGRGVHCTGDHALCREARLVEWSCDRKEYLTRDWGQTDIDSRERFWSLVGMAEQDKRLKNVE